MNKNAHWSYSSEPKAGNNPMSINSSKDKPILVWSHIRITYINEKEQTSASRNNMDESQDMSWRKKQSQCKRICVHKKFCNQM